MGVFHRPGWLRPLAPLPRLPAPFLDEFFRATPSKQRQRPAGGLSMPEKPTLYVCHGDAGGPKFHPCRRVQEALNESGIEYDKVVAAHGNPIPFLRKGSRDELRAATGDDKLPALKLPDGTVLTHSRAILAWIAEQPHTATAQAHTPAA